MRLKVRIKEISWFRERKAVYLLAEFRDQIYSSTTETVKGQWEINKNIPFEVYGPLGEKETIKFRIMKKPLFGLFGDELIAECEIEKNRFNERGNIEIFMTKNRTRKYKMVCEIEQIEEEEMDIDGRHREIVHIGRFEHTPEDNEGDEESAENVDEIFTDELEETPYNKKKHPVVDQSVLKVTKYENWQLHVDVLEGKDLVGVDIEPYLKLNFAGETKSTVARIKDNNPSWNNEFEFKLKNTPKDVFLDHILTIRLKSKSKLIGMFKLDMWHVYERPGHKFHEKWAVLTDNNDIKGYVKMNIAIKTADKPFRTKKAKGGESIHRNLMLPDGISPKRKVVDYNVHIYRAIELPRPDESILTTKKMCSVKVEFAKMEGTVEVLLGDRHPVFQKTVTFADFYPVMSRRIKITVEYPNSSEIVGTHYLDINDISRLNTSTSPGFGPTFGPSWVHLYGHWNKRHISEGLGEGACYRGRLLIAIECRVSLASETGTVEVKDMRREDLDRGNRTTIKEKFRLFGAIYDISMINKKYNDKLTFLMSIGENGDPRILSEKEEAGRSLIPCKTRPLTVEAGDVPYVDLANEKQCLNIDCNMDDERGSLVQRIMLENIHFKVKEAIRLITDTPRNAHKNVFLPLKKQLKSLRVNCKKFCRISETMDFEEDQLDVLVEIDELDSSETTTGTPRPVQKRPYTFAQTYLESELLECRTNSMLSFILLVEESFKAMQTPNGIMKVLDFLAKIDEEISELISMMQQSFPDIFLWMVHKEERTAYIRIPAHSVFYSQDDFESGRFCGQVQTIFFRLPEEKEGKFGWKIQAKMDLLLWFGAYSDADHILDKAPEGFEIKLAQGTPKLPIHVIPYREHHIFQLRAYIYQGRNLIPSDRDGLADPFANIILGNQLFKTSTKNGTRNPIWNQMLHFNNVVLWGTVDSIAEFPPVIAVEILDQDPGRVEFMGRTLIKPTVWNATELELLGDLHTPPDLEWFPVTRMDTYQGEILAAFELVEMRTASTEQIFGGLLSESGKPIPAKLQPKLKKHKIELLIWGVRSKKNSVDFDRPRVEIDYGYTPDGMPKRLDKVKCQNAQINPNFENQVCIFDAQLPQKEKFKPPLTILVYDKYLFWEDLFGSHVVKTMHDYVITREKAQLILSKLKPSNTQRRGVKASTAVSPSIPITGKSEKVTETAETLLNWWERFYQSIDEHLKESEGRVSGTSITAEALGKRTISYEDEFEDEHSRIVIYDTELENVKLFGGFKDFCQTFDLGIGKMTDAKHQYHSIGSIKAAIRIWPYDLPPAYPIGSNHGSFGKLPSHHPINIVVRVYCIQAFGLASADPNGKADPYLMATLGNQTQGNPSDFVAKNLSPEFGRVFEFKATLPQDHTLEVMVKDHDYMFADDLIGSTTIDIEDRYFSKHRATCGLQEKMTMSYWRDVEKPSEILYKLCEKENLPPPTFLGNMCAIGKMKYVEENNYITDKGGNRFASIEPVALKALHHFHQVMDDGYKLVPEHVETRTLYHENKGKVPQGHLQMWVDIFPADAQLSPPVDISLPKPEEMELRVTVLNVKGIPAVEHNIFTGLDSTDIFVKGWVQGLESNLQETDVHYRSTSGHGMFNWRFLFPFSYDKTKRQIVVARKIHLWDIDEQTDIDKPFLHIEVWDADVISRDDFIGSNTFNLLDMEKPAKTWEAVRKRTSTKISTTKISLFKVKKLYGWWPLKTNCKSGINPESFKGAVELEFNLVAKKSNLFYRVGKGREDPYPLPMPQRPSDSEKLCLSPVRVLHLMVCNHKWLFTKVILVILLIGIIFAFFRSIPTAAVNKII